MNNFLLYTTASLCAALVGCSDESVELFSEAGNDVAAADVSITTPTPTPTAEDSPFATSELAPTEPTLTAPVAPVAPLAPTAPLAPVAPNAAENGQTTLIPTDGVVTEDELTATYRITFDANWTESTHPVQFPVGSDHFSPLIGAVHNEQVIFFEPGQIASDGIEVMAETGDTALFISEINESIENGSALFGIAGEGIGSGDGEVSVDVTVTVDFSQITVTSMLAPSPDWFVGLHNFDLHDGVAFTQSIVVDAILYDSGTDSGVSYESNSSDTQPRDPILPTSSEAQDTSFIDGQPAPGQFIIEKL